MTNIEPEIKKKNSFKKIDERLKYNTSELKQLPSFDQCLIKSYFNFKVAFYMKISFKLLKKEFNQVIRIRQIPEKVYNIIFDCNNNILSLRKRAANWMLEEQKNIYYQSTKYKISTLKIIMLKLQGLVHIPAHHFEKSVLIFENVPTKKLKDLFNSQGVLPLKLVMKSILPLFLKALNQNYSNNIYIRFLLHDSFRISFDKGIVFCDFQSAVQSLSGEINEGPHPNLKNNPSISPEVYWGDTDYYQGKPAQMFSLGVLLISLLTGSSPFKNISDKTYDQILKKQKTKFWERFERIHQDQECQTMKAILQSLIARKPSQRLTLTEINKIIPWQNTFQDNMRVLREYMTSQSCSIL